MNTRNILNTLNFIIPLCYVVVGCILMTDLIDTVDRGKRILFGVIVIAYGIFRIYKAYAKIRDKE
jgi:hypothetical protein